MKNDTRHIEWFKICEIVFIFTILPTIAFYSVGMVWPGALSYCYHFIITIFVIQAALSCFYSVSALPRRKFRRAGDAAKTPIPKTTFIVCAYLPNELDVIEKTLLNILKKVKRPANGIEVVLSYNTPFMQGIEPRLKELACEFPELILANAYGSKSKSENLNYALELASGKMIVMLDADHLVNGDCLEKAWRWLDCGYDVVQGRCIVRNGDDNKLAALIEVEFEAVYGVNHFARSWIFNTGLFGGSNGYWKSEVIKSLKFRTDMLTEDIDTTLRALLAGYKIVHDRSIISTELAPLRIVPLWYQRKRWSQGWYQCSVRYQWAVLKNKYFNLRQRFCWSTLLLWRVLHDVLSQLLFPILFAYWLLRQQIDFPMTPYIWFVLICTLGSGPFEVAVAYKNAVRPRASIGRYIYYGLMTFPYALFKILVHIVAIRDEITGSCEWVVSPRTANVQT